MYRVIIADDEVAARSMLRTLIEREKDNLFLLAEAKNSAEALELTAQLKPDLLITDICMPGMDGVELCECVKEVHPEIELILLSGYQKFDYAQKAIHIGVREYLLKPIHPKKFREVIESSLDSIRQRRTLRRNQILAGLGEGKKYDSEELEIFFPHKSYYLVLMRKNGLLPRFGKAANRELFSDLEEPIIFYGRNEREALLLIPEEIVNPENLLEIPRRLQSKCFDSEAAYMTVVYSSKPICFCDFSEYVERIQKVGRIFSTIGKTQSIDICVLEKVPSTHLEYEEMHAIEVMLEPYIKANDARGFLESVDKLFALWGRKERTQFWIEQAHEVVLDLLLRYREGPEKERSFDRASIEDLFADVESVSSLAKNLMQIYEELLGKNDQEYEIHSEHSFGRVIKFLETHLEEHLTIQDLCSNFAVSQTTMNRLFRRYAGASFIQIQTRLRMERAAELIVSSPEMLVRDVARMCGYDDQFYFSRVFRSYFGKAPSQYAEEAPAH